MPGGRAHGTHLLRHDGQAIPMPKRRPPACPPARPPLQVGPTGVEMEALTAASVAALTVYDMVKAASKGVVITDLRLLAKSGGRSGDYRRGGGWAGASGGAGGEE